MDPEISFQSQFNTSAMKNYITSQALMTFQTIKYVISVSLCLFLFISCGNKNQSLTYRVVAIADEEQTSCWLDIVERTTNDASVRQRARETSTAGARPLEQTTQETGSH
jgi:hypothetical protein